MQYRDDVSSSPRFLEMPELPQPLRAVGTKKYLAKGERITEPDSQWAGCYYVDKGLICAYSIDWLGNESQTLFFESGTMFLEANMLDEAVLAKSDLTPGFLAEQDCDLLFIPQERFQYLMRTDPEVGNYVACSIAQKMLAFRFLYHETRLHSVLWRVANLFLSFAENHGIEVGDKVKIDYAISQQFVANVLGINRISAAKSMKQLKDAELIEKTNDHYCVTDLDKLHEFLKRFS